jgi:hypothetical protein
VSYTGVVLSTAILGESSYRNTLGPYLALIDKRYQPREQACPGYGSGDTLFINNYIYSMATKKVAAKKTVAKAAPKKVAKAPVKKVAKKGK